MPPPACTQRESKQSKFMLLACTRHDFYFVPYTQIRSHPASCAIVSNTATERRNDQGCSHHFCIVASVIDGPGSIPKLAIQPAARDGVPYVTRQQMHRRSSRPIRIVWLTNPLVHGARPIQHDR